jgi:hypothetical protein
MKSLTRIQRVTLFLMTAALLWEIAIRIWARSLPPHDPVIRADLLVIIPLLVVFVGFSIAQMLKKPSK